MGEVRNLLDHSKASASWDIGSTMLDGVGSDDDNEAHNTLHHCHNIVTTAHNLPDQEGAPNIAVKSTSQYLNHFRYHNIIYAGDTEDQMRTITCGSHYCARRPEA